jgi:hypothetical protein
MSDPKIEAVQRVYEPYGRGDGSEVTEQTAAAFK